LGHLAATGQCLNTIEQDEIVWKHSNSDKDTLGAQTANQCVGNVGACRLRDRVEQNAWGSRFVHVLRWSCPLGCKVTHWPLLEGQSCPMCESSTFAVGQLPSF